MSANKAENNHMSEIILSQLAVYPVKSLRQISLNKTRLEAFGLEHDRRWMVVDAQGVMLTQRRLSRMCLLQPLITATGISIASPAGNILLVDIPQATQPRQVKVWDDLCRAYDAGDAAAEWLSGFLETECRLVYFPDDELRQVDLNYAQVGDRTAFSDGFPLLLISEASLDDLNQRLATPIPMARFRPNLVVSGCEPFAEDQWRRIRIAGLEIELVKPCSRCVIPSIDINTAERSEEPTRTLLSYRKHDNKIYFGQNVIARGSGWLSVGMAVEIIE